MCYNCTRITEGIIHFCALKDFFFKYMNYMYCISMNKSLKIPEGVMKSHKLKENRQYND